VHGTRSGAPETYPLARRGGEHRAPQQMAPQQMAPQQMAPQ